MNIPPKRISILLTNFGNLSLGDAFFKQFFDERSLGMQFILSLIGLLANGSSQNYTFSLFPCQCFFGPLADEVSFNLSRKTESESQYLALNIFAKPIVVLDCPDPAFLRHTDIQDFHNHEEVSAQTG